MPDPARRQEADQEPELPKKEVSAKAAKRLELSRQAIEATKRVMAFGAGNQIPAIQATRMNSRHRLGVMRDSSYWEIAPEVADLARENPEALIAAKADLAQGGNCGEHAWVAYHYLRQHAAGEPLMRAAKEGLDHAFVLVGNPRVENDDEVAVADPWPYKATACLWEDHFAHCPDDELETMQSMVADGQSAKEAIAAGLRLTDEGKREILRAETEEKTQKSVENWEANHYWNHPHTVKTDEDRNPILYNYQQRQETQ